MKKTLLFAISFTATILFAIPEMPQEYRATPKTVIEDARNITKQKYPDANFVILDDRVHTKYEADGSSIFWDDEWEKVLDEPGRRDLSTIDIHISRRYSDAEIQLVEIYDVNGNVRTIDFHKTLSEVSDTSNMDMNIYDPMDKIITCSIPGLKIGETRHVVWAYKTFKPRMQNAWFDSELLELSTPIRSSIVTVDAPTTLPLVHTTIRDGNHIITSAPVTNDNRILYSWKVKDVPQIFPEPMMPAFRTCAGRIMLSTLNEWQDVSKWYYNLCESHLAKTNEAMAKKAQELATIDNIYRFVSQEIRYMGLTLEDTAPGYEPHDVDITFNNRYGVCRDKAALLVAMLRLAGYESYPVLIHAGAKMDPTVPSPYFNHAIAAIYENGKYILLDPTDESSKDLLPSYLSGKSYLIAHPEGESLQTTPAPDIANNLMNVNTTITFAPDASAILNYDITTTGLNDNFFRMTFADQSPIEAQETILGLLKFAGHNNLELINATITPKNIQDTTEPISINATLKATGLITEGKHSNTITIPYFTQKINFANSYLTRGLGLDERRFPLSFSTTIGVHENITINYSAISDKVISIPQDISLGSNCGYNITRTTQAKDGTIQITRKEELTSLEIPSQDYSLLRSIRSQAEVQERDLIHLAPSSTTTASITVDLLRRDIHLQTPYTWCQTNTLEATILTYKGKNHYSDIRMPYNTHIGTADIIEGTVTTKDGTVSHVTPKEINDLDPCFRASAPRYEGELTKVINLPSIDIGSKFRTTFTRTYTNSPYAFMQNIGFTSDETVKRREWNIYAPTTLPIKYAIQNPQLSNLQVTITTNAQNIVHYSFISENATPLPQEDDPPPFTLWETCAQITTQNAKDFTTRLRTTLENTRKDSTQARALARKICAQITTPEAKIEAIRSHLLKNIRKVLISKLFDTPQCSYFSPDRVLKDSYSSDMDYQNLTMAMLEEVGFDVDLCLAMTHNSTSGIELGNLFATTDYMKEYIVPIIKATYKTGIFPFRKTHTFYLDPNATAYTPAQTYAFGNSQAISLKTGKIFTLQAPPTPYADATHEIITYNINQEGDAQITYDTTTYGPKVGELLKSYIETTPENRLRADQTKAQRIARGATVITPYTAITNEYPFTSTYAIKAPEYAHKKDNTLTITLPNTLENILPSIGFAQRHSPILLEDIPQKTIEEHIIFPSGYTQIENLPPPITWIIPGETTPSITQTITTDTIGTNLEIIITTKISIPNDKTFTKDFAPYFRALQASLLTPAHRTLTIAK